MSVQAIAWVLEHSASEHSERLVLLSYANHASGDGGSSYPSIPTVAREARLGESTVRGAIERLKVLGELKEEEGLSPRRTRAFRLVMPPQNLHPRRIEKRGPQNRAPGSAESAPEPSIEPSKEPTPPVGPPQGGRRRDQERRREERVSPWRQHFPGAPDGYIVHALDRLEGNRQALTVEALRPHIEYWTTPVDPEAAGGQQLTTDDARLRRVA